MAKSFIKNQMKTMKLKSKNHKGKVHKYGGFQNTPKVNRSNSSNKDIFWTNVVNSSSAEDFWKNVKKEQKIQLSSEDERLINLIAELDINIEDDDNDNDNDNDDS